MNKTFEENIGGIEYLKRNQNIYLPYLIIYTIGFLVGITGNLLIMFAIIITKELHNVTNMLIFNLSLADITISAIVDTFSVVGILAGRKWFEPIFSLCQAIAATCLVACATSMVNIGFLAFNRYLNICHHQLFLKIFTNKKTLLYCAITWLIGFLVDLPNMLGWGRHGYDIDTLSCLWDRRANHGYTLFFPLTTIVIPCCCVMVFYIKIFLFIKNSKKRVNPNGGNVKIKSEKKNSQIEVAKGLFGAFSLFTLCWLPYGLVVMTDWYYTYPSAASMYTLLIAHMNAAMNPIFYALFNPSFKRGYKNIIRLVLKKPLEQKTGHSTVLMLTKRENTLQLGESKV